LRIAALPPPALRIYRARVDSQAKKWLDQATATRDTALLQRLLHRSLFRPPPAQGRPPLRWFAVGRGGLQGSEAPGGLLRLAGRRAGAARQGRADLPRSASRCGPRASEADPRPYFPGQLPRTERGTPGIPGTPCQSPGPSRRAPDELPESLAGVRESGRGPEA